MAEAVYTPPEAKTEVAPPQPEQIGFEQKQGLDVQQTNFYGTPRTINTTGERRSRWTRTIGNLHQVAGQRESRTTAVNNLNAYLAEVQQGENSDPDLEGAIGISKDILASYADPLKLKLVLQRGARESTQYALYAAGRKVVERYNGQNSDIASAVSAAQELTQELYAQEHNGMPYMPKEQKTAA